MTHSEEDQMPQPGRRRPESRHSGGTPRWVKATIVAIGILLLAFVALHLAGLSPMMGH
ncbi:hypothetical protein [Sinomonas sp. B1-1]|uniref:hypothetical protein n=1 Tax=Sinomonas sp. B1-1 TaxID=3141454 RepID=UPI003D2D50A1